MKKIFLYSFIIFLCLSALLAIISVLNSGFGRLELKFPATTSAVAIASICALACSQHPWGIAGTILATASALMIVFGVWLDMSQDIYWRIAAILSVFAIAFAHTITLLSVPLARYLWLKITTGISISVLALLLAFLFIIEFSNVPNRLLTVISILVALQTVVIPILARLTKKIEKLILVKQEDGTFQSSDGRYFNLTEISRPYNEL